ncbi:MAG TPA: SDR family NAD(P)-dependent oxidoreductase [Candidatus Binataceae bacterium]|nr:SDR family NAD(P)-dependent oxidoreductase [Candidatus Binataceae bacterium]
MERIDGKTAFITGGSRGIGLGIARAFAAEGAKLALVDVDEPSLTAARAELGKVTSVETFVLDVRDRAAYARVADEVESRLGPVSILCNNAGVAGSANVAHMTYELWDWVIGINLHGVINGIQTFVPRMIERKTAAHIVNTASGAGLVAVGSGYLYTTSKFAVVGLSESMRNELEPFGIGMSVLCPGPVATNIVQNTVAAQAALPGAGQRAMTTEQIETRNRALAVATSFLAGGVPPDEVGRMVLSGIKANRLHIITDNLVESAITARTKALLAAIPGNS